MHVWTELVCNVCACTTAGQFTFGAIRRKEMKAEAVKNGWIFRKGEIFCRVVCLETWLADNTPP